MLVKVVHVTPHLGGGVGKALASLIQRAAAAGPAERHAVLCLEEPRKRRTVDAILATGCRVMIEPSIPEATTVIADADIVQLEFWNHPEIPRLLCSLGPVPMRLLAWCHVSGLHTPQIPPGLLATDATIVFTSACSLENPIIRRSDREFPVVSSGCIDDLPAWREKATSPELRVGYVGTLNFTKLHPNFVDFLASLPDQVSPVHLYGDALNQEILESRCAALGRPGLLRFHGHVTDIAGALAGLDVLAYLLAPHHYGTAENALIEAMAMGVVPIVLDNPAERAIVADGDTGYVIRDKQGFQAALCSLLADSKGRLAMGRRAADSVRERFTAERMAAGLGAHYRALMLEKKRVYRFLEIFGPTPGAWFGSFQPEGIPDLLQLGMIERSKGSVHHFLAKFPDDPDLRRWAALLEAGPCASASAVKPSEMRA
jgi:glycosyltransferase involved in cell wall biosynthesis